eukprot:8559_1
MISWFTTKSTVITLIVKTTDGNLEDTIQIQSDQSVRQFKTVIDETFKCDPEQQKLVYHGQELQDERLLSSYNMTDHSTILLINTAQTPPKHAPNDTEPQRRNMFDKSNPFYPKHSNAPEPGVPHQQNNGNNPQYFDPILNKLAQYHPSLPIAVMENATPIGELMRDLNKKFATENDKLNAEQQSLTAYYYYASLASLSAATKTVASSVYERLPSKEEIASVSSSTSRASLAWIQHLVRNSKEEKESIDRLVLLGFNRKESVEAYLACDKDEALAALFMSQNADDDHITKGNDEESKSVDASVGYVEEDTIEHKAMMKQRNAPLFKQFESWIRGIFDDDELYYRYLLLFMRRKIADMSCLEDIDFDEEYLISIGVEHVIHRKRIMKAIDLFLQNQKEFEIWWNKSIRFKKYLQLFEKQFGIWDLEELLLQIRGRKDILDIIGLKNKDDVECIWTHIHNLRQSHSLYSGAANAINKPPAAPIETPTAAAHAYNPNAIYTNNMNYSAPPIVANEDADDAQKEGVITQM